MNRNILIITLAMLLFPLSSMYAAEVKLGYVDAGRLLEEAPQAGAASNALKQEFASREQEMIDAQKKLQELEDKLTRDSVTMSDAEQKKLQLDILSRKRELGRKQDELKEDFNIRRNDEIAKLQKLIKQAIEDVGKEGKYDLIFYDGISFANPSLDITNEVLQRLGTGTKNTLEKPPQ